MLAYTIYIIGTRKFLPHEGKKNQRFLRDAYRDASQYFTSRFAPSVAASATAGSSSSSSVLLQSAAASPSAASAKLIGFGKAEYLHSHFYVNIYEDEERQKLDEMWLQPILQIGEVVAGDEKLFHYTAHHMNTKAVPQKKDVCSFCSFFFRYFFFMQTYIGA